MQTGEITTILSLVERSESAHAPLPQSVLTALIRNRASLYRLIERIDVLVGGAAPQRPPPRVTAPIPRCRRVPIVGDIAVSAIPVSTFAGVGTDGQIYYVEQADCFAVRIGGVLLHGNIGKISDDGHRTHECRYGATCDRRDKCRWYHDPIQCGGTDRRDFTPASWIHTPASRPRAGTRHIGSRDTLEEDIAGATPADMRLLSSQAMHELLLIIASQQAADK